MKIGNKGFSLVEILIVVSILGILGAIVYPEYQSHAQEAKESAAKQNLRILRNTIELYTAEHEGTPPGYLNGDLSQNPTYIIFAFQLTKKTDKKGRVLTNDATDHLGPYLTTLPKNPFNEGMILKIVTDAFPASYVNDEAAGSIGWLYKPTTKEVKINWFANDSKSKPINEY